MFFSCRKFWKCASFWLLLVDMLVTKIIPFWCVSFLLTVYFLSEDDFENAVLMKLLFVQANQVQDYRNYVTSFLCIIFKLSLKKNLFLKIVLHLFILQILYRWFLLEFWFCTNAKEILIVLISVSHYKSYEFFSNGHWNYFYVFLLQNYVVCGIFINWIWSSRSLYVAFGPIV